MKKNGGAGEGYNSMISKYEAYKNNSVSNTNTNTAFVDLDETSRKERTEKYIQIGNIFLGDQKDALFEYVSSLFKNKTNRDGRTKCISKTFGNISVTAPSWSISNPIDDIYNIQYNYVDQEKNLLGNEKRDVFNITFSKNKSASEYYILVSIQSRTIKIYKIAIGLTLSLIMAGYLCNTLENLTFFVYRDNTIAKKSDMFRTLVYSIDKIGKKVKTYKYVTRSTDINRKAKTKYTGINEESSVNYKMENGDLVICATESKFVNK
jgi:hypothetical protein